MRTGTLTRPNEIVPLQIGRATKARYPAPPGVKTGPVFDLFERRKHLSYKASPPNGGLGSRPASSRPRHVYGRGISLWIMWKRAARGPFSAARRHLADCAEPHTALPAQVVSRDAFEELEELCQRLPEQPRSLVEVGVGTTFRLRDDRVDHAELEAVGGIGLERGGRLPSLPRIAPEDRRATLGRDHGVDRVLLHQHAIGERRRNRTT